MKRGLFLLLLVVFAGKISAQNDSTFVTAPLFEDDLKWVLENRKIYTYQTDLRPVKDKNYELTLYVDEYHKRDSVHQVHSSRSVTRRSIEERHFQMERLQAMFHFLSDSVAMINIHIPDFSGFGVRRSLIPLENDTYLYNSRPFAPSRFETGKKIPLVLFGSFWKDERFGVYRFCGMKELPPDMKDEMFDLIPHYFIVSIRIDEVDE